MILLAVVLVFGLVVGCGKERQEKDEDLELVTVFELSTNAVFQGFPIGPMSSDDLFEDLMLTGAGNPVVEIVANPVNAGKNSLLIKSAADWGDGFDFRQADFRFRADDIITVVGEVITITGANDRIQLNNRVGAENSIASATATGAFSFNVTLDAGMISQINGSAAATRGIRFEMRNGTANIEVRIDEITVTGMRSSAPITPTADDFSFGAYFEDGVSVQYLSDGEVAGLEVTSRIAGYTPVITVYYEGIEGTSYTKNAEVPQVVGVFEITFNVAATTRYTAASGLEAGRLEIIEARRIATTAVDLVIDDPVGVGTGSAAVISDTSFEVAADNYGAGYAKFKVDFGTGGSLADYERLALTYQGLTGDVGWKPLYILASEDESDFAASVNATHAGLRIATVNYANNGLSPMDFEFDLTSSAALAITAQEVWFVVYLHSNPATFRVSDMVFQSFDPDIPSKAIKFDYDAEAFNSVTDITGIPTVAITGELTLSGTVVPVTATNSTIVWSVSEAGAGVTAVTEGKITPTTAGTVKVLATIQNGTSVGENFTKEFTIEILAFPEFSDAEFVGRFTSGNNLGFNGLDGDLDWELFTDSTFIIFGFFGSNANNRDGFGGIQLVTQYSGDIFGWNQYETPGWTGFSNTANEIVFYVFPMNALLKYDDICNDPSEQVKIVLNTGFGSSYIGAWFTDAALVQGDGVMHGPDGWITRDTGLTAVED